MTTTTEKSTITMTLETDAGTYQHPWHLGTEEGIARFIAEEYMTNRTPKRGRVIATIALHRNGSIIDVLSSDERWESER